MFYSLTGKIIMSDLASVAVDCGGVGFKCLTSANTLRAIGNAGAEVTLYTHLSVREDALDLYGFATPNELECFKKLITVSGVGPKVAAGVLSELTPDRVYLAIASADAKTLSSAPGIGLKTAERLIIELKSKIKPSIDFNIGSNASASGKTPVSGNQNALEAVSALVALGYSQSEAAEAVSRLDGGGSLEDMIKQALKSLAGI
ncbi:MAG: Holliday junction branch migration protein RuvA [Oscillospiraceae bacterium]|nr:Holliday junction branch migration protein RuvA [Oscillospiraceae bacterium]